MYFTYYSRISFAVFAIVFLMIPGIGYGESSENLALGKTSEGNIIKHRGYVLSYSED